MPTIAEYRDMLSNATKAGDTIASEYFRSQIERGGASVDPDSLSSGGKGSVLSPIAQGLSFGFSDEMAGGVAGLAEMAKGGDFSEGYEPVVKDFREAAKQYGDRNPITSLVAEIGSGLALPGGLMRQALKQGMKAAPSGLKTVLGAGSLYGTGTAEGDAKERLKGALKGAATGALGYGALKGGMGLAKGIFGRGSPRSRLPSHEKAVKTLNREGIKVTAPEELADMNTRQSYEALRRVFHKQNPRPQQLYGKLMSKISGPGYGFKPSDVKVGDLSREAVEGAKRRYAKAYDDVFEGTSMDPKAWWKRFLAVESRFDDLLPHERGAAKQIVTDFQDMIDRMTTLSGRDYKRIRSGLTDKANKARSNPQYQGLSSIFRGLRDTLDEGFRAVVPAKKAARLKQLDATYGGYKQLSKAADNPEAIGTFVNAVRRDAHRLPKDFVELATAYQNVILRGYPQSSMTPEGMAFGDLLRIGQHGLRAATAPISRGVEQMRGQVVPKRGQRAPERRAAMAQLEKLLASGPAQWMLPGAGPFIAGQQAGDSFFGSPARAMTEGR